MMILNVRRFYIVIMIVITIFVSTSCGALAKTQLSEVQDYLDLGQKYLLDGNYEQAIVAFEKVIEIDPKNVDAYLGLADVYVAQGDYDSAIAVLEHGYAETNSDALSNRINELRVVMASITSVTEVTTVPETTTTPETTTLPETTAEPEPEEDKIADIVWTLEDGVLTISGEGEMPDYWNLEEIPWYDRRDEIEQLIVLRGIKSIGVGAFAYCNSLTSVIMPAEVTCIGDNAFSHCYNLASITLPDNLISIGYGAFWDCLSLPSLTIPDGVTSIGEWAFCDCGNFTSITIPDGVTSIGEWAFRNCVNLTSFTMPDSVINMGENVLYGCDNLTIYAHAGTHAEQYAKENNIPFIAQ